jgi:hypothetical protein
VALLNDENYGTLQSRLGRSWGGRSHQGGGIRKIRVAVAARGKRGGARIIYYWAVRKDMILLLYAYAKNVSSDLTATQIAKLGKAVKEEFGHEE